MQKSINGATFRKMVLNGAKLLDANKAHVNELNVFPVPDGDTGTNMSMTMLSASREVSGCSTNNMPELCDAVAKGALRGARGNSGVILSQILKGMTSVLAQNTEITAKVFAKAFAAGTEIAYKAVTKPKEGTILTVVRAISESAEKAAKKNVELKDFFQAVIDAGEEMLKQTPEMLPVLKKAGVVDAGGRGLLILLQGFQNILLGQEEDYSIEFDDSYKAGANDSPYDEQAHFNYNDLAEIEFAYCTEFFIINLYKKTTEADIDLFREKLMNIGDCVLVIGDLSMVKVHVHSNAPGQVLTYALELGELDHLKIENMLQQNRDLKSKQQEDLKPFGLVSVCAGDGLTAIFKDLLVDNVIEGGQTMNPSADDIAKACDAVAAKDVFVFPNNKNIVLAANQAKALSKRTIHVIPTSNIPQGLSAVLAFNPEDTVDGNLKNMNDALGSVRSGSVTYAVRSTQIGNFDLKEGDIIGMDAKDIVAKGDSVNQVTEQLIDKMMDDEVSCISLYFGNDVKEEDANAIAADITKKYRMCDVDVHYGGQPLYYFIVSLE
ncbi:DAK2 domain-containing protein [Anaerocaecibacter muris]|uniref:DAK2 domain-containing protein n=1 Tax=Anaerocaecibacter muris TaxID=2941513 RepID=UPI00203A816C|nr:DAK2 domain-containing protein [Anaerocaecibacter muris]